MANKVKFSISLPVYNSAKYLKRCLDSIYSQDYPAELIEVIAVDGGSTDNSISILKEYPVKILDNPLRLGEYGMKIAVENASGDLLVLFAADNGLPGTDWFKKVASVFIENQSLSCVWGKMIASEDDPAIMRYYELIQSEPLAYFLNKNLDGYLKGAEIVNSAGLNYSIFKVSPLRPLCWGANGIIYKLSDVRHLFMGDKYIGDNEIFQYMVESGSNMVAYSKNLNIYHHTVGSVKQWVGKWKRNYTQIFLKTRNERRIDWFYCGNFRLKMLAWIFYSLVPVFSGVHAAYMSIRDKNIYWAYHPLMCFLQTCTYLFWTIVLREGRKSLIEHLYFRKAKL
ncbi:MAG: glycosyltransferase [Candidatus Omnitrophota bacterium]|jgi:glycosyltransferase involved in cell wall biosynthesis|nr:MAG: glycosyltransferase [Candidatus Omnitrophota bacterium]